MDIFTLMKDHRQEQIAFYSDVSVNLRAVLAIHSTALGPAIGGIRILKYATIEDALFDLMRLSRAMSYKTAAAGLNFGGGEVVIIDQGMERNEALFRSIGRFIEGLKGRIIVGGDIGVTEDSMEYMHMETKYVTGLPAYYGGSGDHDSMCAYGTFLGILAAVKHVWGAESLAGKKAVIQGYGRIGSRLAEALKERGAEVAVSDISPERSQEAEKSGFSVIVPEEVYDQECDIFAPCAVGAVITPDTVKRFRCRLIAGSANNQLLQEEGDLGLKKAGIVWAPDLIINAGGIIDVVEEYTGYKQDKVKRKVENIYDRTLLILERADKEGSSVQTAAFQYALERIDSIKKIRGTFPGKGKI